MGSVVNRALPSLHGGSLEITLTVPLRFNDLLKIESKEKERLVK